MHPLSQFATEVAPHVDRLVLAVHRQMRTFHGPAIETWRADSELERPGILINLRPFFLAGSQNRSILDRLHRYALPGTIDESIRAAIDQGLIDETLAPSHRGDELARRLTNLQSSLIEELWGGQTAVPDLIQPLSTAVDGVIERYPGSAFTLTRAFAGLPRPEGSAPYLIHHLLTVLRYLRSDSHTVVIDAAGLSAGEAARLDAAWRKLEGPHHEHPLQGLVDHGFLDLDGNITDDGRHARQTIEDETNSVAAAAWESLRPEQLPELLGDLSGLPDRIGA